MELSKRLFYTGEAVTIAVASTGNAIVLIAIAKNRHLHTVSNIIIGNLALADGMTGAIATSMSILVHSGHPKNFYGCLSACCVILVCVNAARIMCLVVAMERFLAIRCPFRYTKFTNRDAVITNCVVWVAAVTVGFVPLYGWRVQYFEITTCDFEDIISTGYLTYIDFFGFILMLLITFAIYTYIFVIATRLRRRTRALQRLFLGNKASKEQRAYNKKTIMMFAIVLMYPFLEGPILLTSALRHFWDLEISYNVRLCLIGLSHTTSCFNALIYAYSGEGVKQGIKVLFGHRGDELTASGYHKSECRFSINPIAWPEGSTESFSFLTVDSRATNRAPTSNIGSDYQPESGVDLRGKSDAQVGQTEHRTSKENDQGGARGVFRPSIESAKDTSGLMRLVEKARNAPSKISKAVSRTDSKPSSSESKPSAKSVSVFSSIGVAASVIFFFTENRNSSKSAD